MFLTLTKSTTFIIGPIAQLFGMIMNAIYNFFFNVMGIESLGVSIIIFTLLVKLLMMPLTIKQQKSSKDMQKIQPKIKKLQAKYKNKKDQESQRKLQTEMSKIYKENNVNPIGGCLPLLVQFPVLFALFAVLRNIPAYINSVKEVYIGIINQISSVPGYEKILETFEVPLKQIKEFSPTNQDKVIDLLAKFNSSDWNIFRESFDQIGNQIAPLIDKITSMNYFLTINLADKPVSGFSDIISVGALIPLLCFVAQILVTKTTSMPSGTGDKTQDQTQKTMMYAMPVITVFFVLQMPAGLGLYWLTSNIFQLIQQVIINKHLQKDIQ